MLNLRRVSLAVVAAGVVAVLPALLSPPAAIGQGGKQPLPKQPEYKPGVKFSAIKLIEDAKYQNNIDQAIDSINDGAWPEACDYLQALLDSKEDVYAKVEITDPKTGEKKARWSSVKIEANNLLAHLPAEGLNVYELKFGAEAKKLLEQARTTGGRDVLGDVAFRYQNTKAGAIANDLLATSYLDRGDFFNAALRFERLIGPDLAKTTANDLMLFKATLAFKLAGDINHATELEKVLYKRIAGNGGLALANGQMASAKQINEVLGNIARPQLANPHDWPLVGGNLARNAQAKGSPPMLDYVLWTRQTFMDKSEDTGEIELGAEAKPYLDEAIRIHVTNNSNMPIMPGGFPIAAGGFLFYRTYNGVTAVALHDTPDLKAGQVHFRSTPFEGSFGNAMNNAGIRSTLDGWIKGVYQASGFANLLYENSTVGTMTTDSRNVYAVDDLAVPIPPKYLMNQFWNNAAFVNDAIKKLVMENTLWAFDIPSGKINWKLGGDKGDEYAQTHFLCAPVSVGGKLYVLNEKNSGDLRLLCLDPVKGTMIGAPQKLGTVKNEHRYVHDMARRVNAIHLAYSEGILVCPTNAGEIMGVDLLSRTLAWAYPYRQKPPNQNAFPKQFENDPRGQIALSYANWKVSPPIIVEGKVVFTAPDASGVHCISLRDGTELWTAPQLDTDLFLAGVFDGKVVIVGKNSIRALRLADGFPIWNHLQTGDLPSGQGVASNDIYYLPLRKGEVCAIDLAKWVVKAHNRSSKPGAAAPGNLVFYEGMVLSQTPTALVAYPQLTAKLTEAEIAYTKAATVENLLFRGELRLADGQVQKAVDDLLEVLAKEPPAALVPRAKSRLYEALTDLLTVDFDKSSPKYLEKYRDLCKVPDSPAEQVQRETKFLRILAQGSEAQGNLVAAFLAYRDYGSSPLFKDDGIPSIEDPLYKVPTNLWLRGRITAMFEKATPTQKGALESKIAEEWEVVKQKNDLNAIRQFTGMFDVPFAVGRDARLELANNIIGRKAKESYLEAELSLQQLRVQAFRKDPAIGGKALEALARLEKAKGTDDALRLAASYYREIFKDFAKDAIVDKKTGADLFHALAEDPRLRPFLEEPGIMWGNAEIKYRNIGGGAVQGVQGFVFQPEGDLTPLMQQHRLVLDPVNQNNPTLRLVDMANNKERWSAPLGQSPINYQFFSYLYDMTNRPMGFYPNAAWRFFHVKGHVAVLQVGMVAYSVDLDNGKVLWSKTLYDPNKIQPNFGWSMTQDEQGRLWVLHQTQVGQTKARIGQVGTVQATYVALITQQGLLVLDPINGKTLWTKPGLAINTEVFGDDQYIYYVETADGAAVGAGRCLRASDGAHVDVPDFGPYYRNKQRIIAGRYILTSEPNGKSLTMRLVDVQTGKDQWKRTFDNNPAVLQTEEWYLCGVVERDTGKLIVVDLRDQKEVVTANLMQGRVMQDDLKDLDQPLFLDDGERYFVALNQKAGQGRILANSVSNNFNSGARCMPVNGWFVALDRKGEFLWHGHDRYMHQMIVVEQFKTLPVLLFTSRYLEMTPQGGSQTIARTGSVSKRDGKAIKWTDPRASNGNAQYYAFNIDLKAGTINMIGFSAVDQWFVDGNPAPKKDERGGEQPKGTVPGGKVGPGQPMPQAVPIDPLPAYREASGIRKSDG